MKNIKTMIKNKVISWIFSNPALLQKNGEKKNVIDVDIPFENPEKCDFEIDTENLTPEQTCQKILEKIKNKILKE